MGFFDIFTGVKRPADNISPKPVADLAAALEALNRDTAPWTISRDESGKADFVAEWKIVDAKWYEIFAKASLTRVFKVYLKFDESKHEVRSVDQEFTVAWRAGVPTIAIAAKAFRGQKSEVSFGTAYAFTEELEYGQVYNYKFETRELKNPLQTCVTDYGWTWRPVAFGKL